MSDTTELKCMECNTPLVPSNKDLTLGGPLPVDGTWIMKAEDQPLMVCPQCHPELVKKS